MHTCHSPVRVTAALLLSFLALGSATSPEGLNSRRDEVQQNRLGSNELPPINLSPILTNPNGEIDTGRNQKLDFRLRHIFHHGTYNHPRLLRRLDVPPETSVWLNETDEEDIIDDCQRRDDEEPVIPAPQPRPLKPAHSFSVSSQEINIQRLLDRSPERMEELMESGRTLGMPVELPASAWTTDTVPAPNVTDKETVLSFARMASNAYILEPRTGDWEEIGDGFNFTESFGWESDGLRGHIFADTENRTVVIGLKGTSPAVFDGADTTTNDKINDNLFFSCCCAQGGSLLWHQVCDCQTATYTCNSTCVVQSLRERNHYYYAAQQLYHNVTAIYPDATIWLAGHSLGGAVSSLLGLTYGIPAVTFEAPGDALPASRLGLPTPPGYHVGDDSSPKGSTGGFHFGHTGDPIYMGTCSTYCSIAGYAMESVCHTGMECRYDTVKDKGFHSYIGNHKIKSVIHDVLEAYDEPAKCEVVSDCVDCYNWKYFKSNRSSTTTTASSSTTSSAKYTKTRTQTCQTPGWWGCLDESTTGKHSATTTTTTTTTSSTSTCKTPGWFGCLDETTTTTTSGKKEAVSTVTTTSTAVVTTTSISTSTSTSLTTTTTTTSTTVTCETPGWFGCKDETKTSKSTSKSTSMPKDTETAVPGETITSGPTETASKSGVRPSSTASAPASSTSTSDSSCGHHWYNWRCKQQQPQDETKPRFLTENNKKIVEVTHTNNDDL